MSVEKVLEVGSLGACLGMDRRCQCSRFLRLVHWVHVLAWTDGVSAVGS